MPDKIFLRKRIVFVATIVLLYRDSFNGRRPVRSIPQTVLSVWITVSENSGAIHQIFWLFLKLVNTVLDHFSEMSQVVLVHRLQTFEVQARLIVPECDLFAHNPGLAASPYTVQSQVSLTDFGEFVSALEGNAITITNDNFKGLSALCDEFGFGDLAALVSQFRDSDGCRKAETVKDSEVRRRLLALEEQVLQRHHDIALLHCKLVQPSQAQESAMEAILERVSRLEADRALVGSLWTEIARLRELQSVFSNEVEEVREQLRDAKESADKAKDIGLVSRAVAEEAEKKAEAHLGRMGRLEAEVMALRSGPVPAETKPAATAPTFLPSIVGEIRGEIDNFRMALKEARELAQPGGWNSAIVPDFPRLMKTKQFTLLWRGSRDGFRCLDFHSRCDGHPNTLTVILDTNGNIFGGFTPVEWGSCKKHFFGNEQAFWKADPSLKSFLFTLKNPHNVPARRFALKAETKGQAIICDSDWGPHFYDIVVSDNCNENTRSYTEYFGNSYTNDTGLDGNTFFTGSTYFQVKEIEVFEITH
jgi:hypothetical protein